MMIFDVESKVFEADSRQELQKAKYKIRDTITKKIHCHLRSIVFLV